MSLALVCWYFDSGRFELFAAFRTDTVGLCRDFSQPSSRVRRFRGAEGFRLKAGGGKWYMLSHKT